MNNRAYDWYKQAVNDLAWAQAEEALGFAVAFISKAKLEIKDGR